MATGIVYTEVDGSADPKIEVARVKRALRDGATKISRTGVRTLANQIAYGNEGGRSLLTLMHKMNNEVLALQKQVDDQQRKHTDSIKSLTETTEALTKEVNTLRPLGENAIEIRKRFFATYRRRKHRRKHDDRTTIISGNFAAHRGDVRLDASLFKNGLIEYEDTFLALYGFSWLEAESLFRCEKFISAMNTRASTIADSLAWWSPAREVAFRKLVKWIKKATDHDLQNFDDDDQDSYPQGLFKILG